VILIEPLPDADRAAVLQFLPAARSVIVFGKEVPVPVHRMPPGEKTREMLRIAESLDDTALQFAGLFEAEHIPAPEAGKDSGAGDNDAPLCTGCRACTGACPDGAIGPDGVDAFRCRTVRTWVPPWTVTAVKWLLRRQLLLRGIAPLAPVIARTATIRCSLCVTGCPVFQGAVEKG
jgi:ferredoxin